jgi:hypothetical protein
MKVGDRVRYPGCPVLGTITAVVGLTYRVQWDGQRPVPTCYYGEQLILDVPLARPPPTCTSPACVGEPQNADATKCWRCGAALR